MLSEICVGDVIYFWEARMVRHRTELGRSAEEEHGRRWVIARATHKTGNGRIAMIVIRSDGADALSRDAKISRKPEKLFSAFASLELKTTGERGELLTCSSTSTHPDARKRLDLAAAIASERNPTRRFSIYEDEIARRIHDDTAQEEKRERLELKAQKAR